MNICYLSHAPTIHTQRWAEEFARRGHTVSVISFRPWAIKGVNVIHVGGTKPLTAVNYLSQVPHILQIVNQLNVDILHSHYCTSYGLIGALCKHHPFIVSAWGSDILISPEKSVPYRLLVRWVLNQADLVTSQAVHMTELMIQRDYVKPNQVITFPFGIDTNEFNPALRKIRANSSKYLVLSTRRLEQIYDISTIINSIPLVIEQIPEARFIVASDGPLRQDLERMASELNIGNHLEFIGWVPQNKLPQLLSDSDIVISAATSDGSCVSLLEAMACGAFPITADIPANREWINHGINGLVFPSGNCEALAENIVNALKDSNLRNNAAMLNWEIIQQRASWKTCMDAMEQQYIRLMKEYQAKKRE